MNKSKLQLNSKSCKTIVKKNEKSNTIKDSYIEIIEELEKYSEGAPLISSHHAFDTCACNHERENHHCDEKCEEFDLKRRKTIIVGEFDDETPKNSKTKNIKKNTKTKHIMKIAKNLTENRSESSIKEKSKNKSKGVV